jgi:hypothetical protein
MRGRSKQIVFWQSAVLTVLVTVGVEGCGASVNFTRTSSVTYPPKSPQEVKLLMGDEKPDCNYISLGFINASTMGGGVEGMMDEIRHSVAQEGGDGALNITMAAPGTVDYWKAGTTATVYRCTAVAR